MLPINLIQDITNVLSKNHLIYIGKQLGVEYLSKQDIRLLKNFGIKAQSLYNEVDDNFLNCYQFGKLVPKIEEGSLTKLKYDELKEVKVKYKLPLSKTDKLLVNGVKQQVVISLKSLQGRITNDITQAIINKYNEIHVDSPVETIENIVLDQEDIKEIVGEISSKTSKYLSDFNRIVHYNIADIFEKGKTQGILEDEGKDCLVYKTVDSKACKHCKRMFKSLSLQPKIYKLIELVRNGSNIGRKPQDWKPTIGPIHPHCFCQLRKVPEGMKYNPKTQQFDLRDHTYKPRKKPKRDKVKIKIHGKEYEI